MRRHITLGLTPIAIAATLACAARSAPAHSNNGGAEPASSAPPKFLYVANQGDASISIIDTETNEVIETVDLESLGYSANAKPHHIAVEPDGSFWYVSLIGEHKVLKFDRENRVVAEAAFETPGMLALHPSNSTMFVGRSMTAPSPPQRIGAIERQDMAIDEIDVFFPRPHAIAIDPSGRYVYTASLAENRIMIIDTETSDVSFVSVNGHTHVLAHFTLSPDGSRLVVSGEHSGQMLIFDASSPPELRLLATVDVNAAPWHPVFTQDGRRVFVGNQRANTVTVIDAVDWKVEKVIQGPGIAEPHGIATSPDGRYVYVSNRNRKGTYKSQHADGHAGTIAVIEAATGSVVKTIEVERGATGLGI